ncbi:MAG: phosphatidylserine decarboxylase family protein [Verrucomicrobiae bacterium]|nr:phosphatidylserine decarboxylase family protein [Verrucomicrobiae bacterium]
MIFTAKTLWEGRWPIIGASVLLAATWLWCRWWPALFVPLVLLGFVLWFFRDPPRAAPGDPGLIVAPADGRVIEIATVHEPLYFQGHATQVGIFMSIFNVHVQRAPVDGRVVLVRHSPGRFLDARRPDAVGVNENRFIGVAGDDGARYAVRQVAGLIARRIVGWRGEGDRVTKGERIGMIRFGSRVDLLVPTNCEIRVRVGDRVKGGESVVAERK